MYLHLVPRILHHMKTSVLSCQFLYLNCHLSLKLIRWWQ